MNTSLPTGSTGLGDSLTSITSDYTDSVNPSTPIDAPYVPRGRIKLKPNQVRFTKGGKLEVKPRFRTTKHRGYAQGAFGRQFTQI